MARETGQYVLTEQHVTIRAASIHVLAEKPVDSLRRQYVIVEQYIGCHTGSRCIDDSIYLASEVIIHTAPPEYHASLRQFYIGRARDGGIDRCNTFGGRKTCAEW